jgi:hypothetical protein
MFTEPLDVTKPAVGVPIVPSRSLFMKSSGYGYLGARVLGLSPEDFEFPTMSPGAPVPVAFLATSDQMSDGDTVSITSLERPIDGTTIGAYSISRLYYFDGFNSPNQSWTVHERDTSVDKVIRFGDELYFINQAYAGQWLCPLQTLFGMYLTTSATGNAFWRCQPTRIRTDFTVWRPNDGTWYIKQSIDGSIVSQRWGWAEDIPVPGDYDGDGKTDYAVWRPSDATWYVMHRWDGSTVSQQWANWEICRCLAITTVITKPTMRCGGPPTRPGTYIGAVTAAKLSSNGDKRARSLYPAITMAMAKQTTRFGGPAMVLGT